MNLLRVRRSTAAALATLGLSISGGASAELVFADKQVERLVRGLAADVRDGKVVEIASGALDREYAKNEVIADNRFKGKYLMVGGVVDSVQKDAFGNIVLKLRGANQFSSLLASFDNSVAVVDGLKKGSKTVTMRTVSAAEAAASVTRGDSIKILCKGKGSLLGSPQLAVCDVVYR